MNANKSFIKHLNKLLSKSDEEIVEILDNVPESNLTNLIEGSGMVDVFIEERFKKDLVKGLDNLSDLVLFRRVIEFGVKKYGELELSVLLKTSRPTIVRWVKGETVPHLIIIESIYKTLLKELSERKI